MSEPPGSPSDSDWRRRFLSTTRGRLLALLRREPRTPADLADALDISPNAVRGHLASLERDGLAEARGVRREGVGKPPRIYGTTQAAEELFPKAYDAVLSGVLDLLEERVGRKELRSLLREVGRRAGREAHGPEDPVARAVAILTELGAEIDLEEGTDGIWFRGHACPLGGLVGHRPELCGMLAALLQEVTGMHVQEHCRRDELRIPRCAFLALPGDERIGLSRPRAPHEARKIPIPVAFPCVAPGRVHCTRRLGAQTYQRFFTRLYCPPSSRTR